MPEPRETNRRRLNRAKRTVGATWLPRALACALLLVAPLLAVGAVSPQAAAAADPLPTLTTDKADYSPNETVHITGTNFVPAVAYDIVVIRPDGSIIKGDGNFNPDYTYTCPGGTPECWDTVTVGLDGSFLYDYILNGIAGSYEVRAYLSPWNGDRSLPALATTTFTDGNVKARTNATGFTFQLDWTRHNGTNPQAQLDCNAPAGQQTTGSEPAVGFSGGAQFSQGVPSDSSIVLKAADVASNGFVFVGWTGETSSDTFLTRPDPHEICVPGNFTSNRTYVANYVQTTAQFVVNKDFVPNNAANVTVALSCTSGTVTNDDTTASESDPANFTVTGFSAGATCTATETVPNGYTANQAGCASQPITNGGTTSCTIVNTDVAPTVTISKVASPSTLAEPGGLFTFTLTITNTSNAADTVTITALTDSQSGAADASDSFADCAALVGTSLAPGASVSCTYAVAHSQAGSYSNTASVTVTDEEGTTASATDTETVFVTFVENGTTITNSAFRLQDDLSPWEISEFEILKQKDGTIVATNPGQFYMHTRVQKVGGDGAINIVMDWDENGFETQGATPVHCYIRPPSGGWSETPCSISINPNTGTVTAGFTAVPDGYTVWVTVHLDYVLKGTKSTDMTPKSYAFTSAWTGGPPPGADMATLVGYPKKTTGMYGYVLDGAGQPLADAKVSITVAGVTYTYTTGNDGFYVFYQGQKCFDDGVTCTGTFDSSTTLFLPNFNYQVTIVAPSGYSTASSGPCSSTTTAYINVNAQGKMFRKDWKLYANALCP